MIQNNLCCDDYTIQKNLDYNKREFLSKIFYMNLFFEILLIHLLANLFCY